MHPVNPELFDPELADKQRVSALFGSSPRVILLAVGNFLGRGPAELDHHNLRIIAAASRAINDPQIVARMIDALPITKMVVAAKPMSMEKSCRQFEQVLSSYPPTTRKNLVDDLMRKTILHFLENSPPEKVPKPARDLVAIHLLELAQSRRSLDQATAIMSPFATREIVDRALDAIERRIERAEQGDTRLPLGLVDETLKAVLTNEDCTTADVVERAWNLAGRCEADESWARVLYCAAKNPELLQLEGDAILDAIDQIDVLLVASPSVEHTRRALRATLVSMSTCPETVARRAVEHGCTDVGFSVVDPRILTLRVLWYSDSSGRDLLPRMTSDEIDERVADLPSKYITAKMVSAMRNSEALRKLTTRSNELGVSQLAMLIHHPHTPDDCQFPRPSRWPALFGVFSAKVRERSSFARDECLISNRRVDDISLAKMVKNASDEVKRESLLRHAVRNPSAGPAVLEIVKTSPYLVAELARSTSSRQMHERLLNLWSQWMHKASTANWGLKVTLRSSALELGRALVGNGTVNREIYERFEQQEARWRGAGESSTTEMVVPKLFSSSSFGYGPTDVATLVLEGAAPPDRVGALVDDYVRNQHQDMADVILQLADRDLLDNVHWAQLTAMSDVHLAMRFATHPRCPTRSSELEPIAVQALENTAEAVTKGVSLPKGRPRSWDRLPDISDLTFPNAETADLLDRQKIDQSELVVLRTKRQLNEAAEIMGNCLAAYADRVHKGRCLVAIATTGVNTLAVAWGVERDSPGAVKLRVEQINSRFNTGDVPSGFREGVHRLTQQLHDGELVPVAERVSSEVEVRVSTSVDRPPRSRVVVHRTPARRRLELAANEDGASQPLAHEVDAPSVLSGVGEEGVGHRSLHEATETLLQDTPVDGDQGMEAPGF